MREYHPLDVRHPSNRDLLRRNYLLEPPSPTAGADKVAINTAAVNDPDFVRAAAARA